jgi:ketosteroid isomerase-like protein
MQDNKTIARELCARFTAGDVDGVLELMTDDVRWLIPGSGPSAGEYDKTRLCALFRRMYARLPHGLSMRMLDAIAEGDRLSFEAESSGDLSNGRQYRQRYHFALQLQDGKIARAREYLDTQHVQDVWFQP